MIPDLAGRTIDIVRLDRGLHLWTDDNWEILMSQPVTVTTADVDGIHQEEITVDVAPQPLPRALDGMEGRTMAQLVVGKEGHLALLLEDRQLSVSPVPKYEAWQIGGHDGELLICGPRGHLVHYPPVRRNAGEDGDVEQPGAS